MDEIAHRWSGGSEQLRVGKTWCAKIIGHLERTVDGETVAQLLADVKDEVV